MITINEKIKKQMEVLSSLKYRKYSYEKCEALYETYEWVLCFVSSRQLDDAYYDMLSSISTTLTNIGVVKPALAKKCSDINSVMSKYLEQAENTKCPEKGAKYLAGAIGYRVDQEDEETFLDIISSKKEMLSYREQRLLKKDFKEVFLSEAMKARMGLFFIEEISTKLKSYADVIAELTASYEEIVRKEEISLPDEEDDEEASSDDDFDDDEMSDEEFEELVPSKLK